MASNLEASAAPVLDGLESNASTLNGPTHDDAASAAIALRSAGGDGRQESLNSQGAMAITPEPRPDQILANTTQTTPSTPGLLPPFDWDDFQSRYEKALAEADTHERAVLDEFERLSKVKGSLYPLTVSSSQLIADHLFFSILIYGHQPLRLTTMSEPRSGYRHDSDT